MPYLILAPVRFAWMTIQRSLIDDRAANAFRPTTLIDWDLLEQRQPNAKPGAGLVTS
jgi:hypothetical protein